METISKDPRKILYVVKSGGGGSLINVLLLVRNLDQRRFRPIVLFHEDNPYVEAFKQAGAEVRLLEDRSSRGSSRNSAAPFPDGLGSKLPDLRLLRPVRQVNGLFRRDWPQARRIAEVIRETKADLVQSNICPSADRPTIIAAWLAGVPQVCYAQYFTSEDSWIDRRIARLVDRHLCISKAVRRQLHRELGLPAERISVVYAPFDFPSGNATRRDDTLRAALGANGRHVLFANVGRIIPWKGQDVFLRAFARIASRFPEARAVIVGSAGDKPQGQMFEEELRRLAVELDLRDCVHFAGHRDDVEAVMRASDVVVHSSSEPEPLGRVIMEAIALGRPVVATDGGGVPEMIENGVTGSLATIGDVGSMAKALEEVLVHSGRAAAMAVRAREKARERFGAGSFARTLAKDYETLFRN